LIVQKTITQRRLPSTARRDLKDRLRGYHRGGIADRAVDADQHGDLPINSLALTRLRLSTSSSTARCRGSSAKPTSGFASEDPRDWCWR